MDGIIILVKILVGIAELKNLIGDPLQRQVINEFSYFSITKYFVKYPNISKKKTIKSDKPNIFGILEITGAKSGFFQRYA